MNNRLKIAGKYVAFIAVPFFIPLFIESRYSMHILIMILINIILATSLRLIMTTGQVSFAHSGFMAIGAYTSTLLVTKMGLSFWVTLLPVIFVSAIIAILFGYATLRIKGVYFFIASLAFGHIILFALIQWKIPFGGVAGIRNIPRPSPLSIPGLFTINITSHTDYYYLFLIFALLTIFFMIRLEKSRIVRIFKAIEEEDILCESIGINLMKHKILAFTIGSIFASIAGSLFACYIRFISPETFNVMIGVDFLVYVMLGGLNSVFGPSIGTVVLIFLSEKVTRMAELFEPMAYGLILIGVMLFLPNGIAGLWNPFIGLVRKIGIWKGKESAHSEGNKMKG